MMGMLERHEIDTFVTLAEELHFGRTSERLGLSTARVSQTIRKLERRVGIPLFNRTSRRVELTTIGKQLYDDVQPAWAQIAVGLARAVDAGRGMTGTLRVGFVGAASGQLVIQATELFQERYPDCAVRIREAQILEVRPWLRDGTVDLALAGFPVDDPEVFTGPVLVSEARMLAVPVQHPFACRKSISVEDLAQVSVLALTESFGEASPPQTPPTGGPIAPRPSAATFQEMLTLVGSGHGVFLVGAHVRRYYARPDVAYVVILDAPPVEWGLVWSAARATARVLAFSAAARDVVTKAA
jgi:DNA-binding transcriptional LysR family regulator